MAVAPLFISSMAVLKSRLRLTAVNQSDADAIIDEAVREVRVELYQALGSSQIATILATASSENPTTDAQLARTKAEMVEGMWVRMLLLDRLPMLVLDAQNGDLQQWNEDGLTRSFSSRERENIRQHLQSRISELLAELQTGTDQPKARAMSLGPETTQPRPGESLYPYPPEVADA